MKWLSYDAILVAIRQVVGWISWFIVATQLYDLACWNVNSSSYFVLPTAWYKWLDDVVGPTSCEASFDLSVWATSISMVLAMHLLAWAVFFALRLARRERWLAWQRWWTRVFPFIGWSSWLLVSTFVLLAIGDAILRARGSALPGHASAFVIEMISGLLVVGSLHLAVLKIARRVKS
jgi:hypothetical protein